MTSRPPPPEALESLRHELRTPLAAVIGWADALRSQALGPLPPAYRQAAEAIHAAGRHMLELADRLVDPGAGAASSVIDAGEIAASVVEMLRAHPRVAQVRLDWRAPAAPLRVSADPLALRQVFVNLLANALAAAPEGGRVAIEGVAAAREVVISVTDDGPGAAGVADGLGLSIVRSLLAEMGGSLELGADEAGGGFARVRLPLPEA